MVYCFIVHRGTAGNEATYTNWATSNPVSSYFTNKCTYMSLSRGSTLGQWYNVHCTNYYEMNFICSHPGSPTKWDTTLPAPTFAPTSLTHYCPPGYTYNEKFATCIYVSTSTVTWNNAKSNCASNYGGRLLSLYDEETANYARESFKYMGNDIWIGLQWSSAKMSWLW